METGGAEGEQKLSGKVVVVRLDRLGEAAGQRRRFAGRRFAVDRRRPAPAAGGGVALRRHRHLNGADGALESQPGVVLHLQVQKKNKKNFFKSQPTMKNGWRRPGRCLRL